MLLLTILGIKRESGDMSKVNLIQSRLDLLNLASYPERAKQIFVKVSN